MAEYASTARGGYVQINTSDRVDSVQERSYTISAWFKPDVPRYRVVPLQPDSGIFTKGSGVEGLFCTAGNQFVMNHLLGSLRPDVDSDQPPPDLLLRAITDEQFGSEIYYHVAGLFDQELRVTRIYVNGRLKGSTSCNKETQAPHFGGTPWKIGDRARGEIRDVRVYSRTLSGGEVEALYNAGCSSDSR